MRLWIIAFASLWFVATGCRTTSTESSISETTEIVDLVSLPNEADSYYRWTIKSEDQQQYKGFVLCSQPNIEECMNLICKSGQYIKSFEKINPKCTNDSFCEYKLLKSSVEKLLSPIDDSQRTYYVLGKCSKVKNEGEVFGAYRITEALRLYTDQTAYKNFLKEQYSRQISGDDKTQGTMLRIVEFNN